MRALVCIAAVWAIAAVPTAFAAGRVYSPGPLRACLAGLPEAPAVSSFSATTYGHGAAPALGQNVVVATFSITARPSLIAFFAIGKDAAEAARLRSDTRRWIARRGIRVFRAAGGGADSNLSWFAIGSMPGTLKDELAACLVQARS